MPDRGQRRIAECFELIGRPKYSVQPRYAEERLDAEGLQLHKTTLGATPVNQEQETEAKYKKTLFDDS